ncbi:MAG: hypothetical protein Q8Q11_02465 [bacterium]|nr:hypothetical protein [bacterium]MDZ4247797.1 hypothetical protein [Patescibacteria group bacterium]
MVVSEEEQLVHVFRPDFVGVFPFAAADDRLNAGGVPGLALVDRVETLLELLESLLGERMLVYPFRMAALHVLADDGRVGAAVLVDHGQHVFQRDGFVMPGMFSGEGLGFWAHD